LNHNISGGADQSGLEETLEDLNLIFLNNKEKWHKCSMFFHQIHTWKSNAFGTFQDLMKLLDQIKDAIVEEEEEGEASDDLACSLNHDFVQEKN
jgi:hypothetical protein